MIQYVIKFNNFFGPTNNISEHYSYFSEGSNEHYKRERLASSLLNLIWKEYFAAILKFLGKQEM